LLNEHLKVKNQLDRVNKEQLLKDLISYFLRGNNDQYKHIEGKLSPNEGNVNIMLINDSDDEGDHHSEHTPLNRNYIDNVI
jgi:hypothetical protein